MNWDMSFISISKDTAFKSAGLQFTAKSNEKSAQVTAFIARVLQLEKDVVDAVRVNNGVIKDMNREFDKNIVLLKKKARSKCNENKNTIYAFLAITELIF